MESTYLSTCLKDGLTVRWPDSAMPIQVYIAPFFWYEKSKQVESHLYHQMVLEALQTWTEATQKHVRFQVVMRLQDSQIDFKWRRVDRTSLGHCEYMVNDRSMIYSAELQIGISDGSVHAQYNDTNEVRHTILHELGHAIGLLGHSDSSSDLMYVPHQYGITKLSPRDIYSAQWLYRLPVGFNYWQMAEKHSLKEPFTFQDVLDVIEGKPVQGKKGHDGASGSAKGSFDPYLQPPAPQKPQVLAEHHDILTQMGKFYLSTQNIRIPPDKSPSPPSEPPAE